MIWPLWELEKNGEEKGDFFPGSVQIWRRGTGADIWGSLPGAGIQACWGSHGGSGAEKPMSLFAPHPATAP